MLSAPRLKQKVTPIARLLSAAGNIHRTSILYMLIREPLTSIVIIRRLRLSPSLLAHHINILRAAGWITKSKFGKLVSYEINEEAVKEVTTFLRKSS